MLVVLELHPE